MAVVKKIEPKRTRLEPRKMFQRKRERVSIGGAVLEIRVSQILVSAALKRCPLNFHIRDYGQNMS